jgi:CspA family cold shock protein
MPLGWIERIVADKGYGFIAPSGGGPDVFFHRSTLEDGAFEQLREGQVVSFETAPSAMGDRGPKAAWVRLYEGPLPRPAAAADEFQPMPRHAAARKRKPTWRG